MEKRALIAIVLSILIIIVYNEWLKRTYGPAPSAPEQQKGRTTEERQAATGPATDTAPASMPPPRESLSLPQPTAPAEAVPVRDVKVETDYYIAIFTTQGARLKSFKLKHYRSSVEKNSPLIDMVSQQPGVPYPLGVVLAEPGARTDAGVAYELKGSDLNLSGDAKGALSFVATTAAGTRIEKRLSFEGNRYAVELAVSLTAARPTPKTVTLTTLEDSKGTKGDAVFEGFLALKDNELLRTAADDLEKPETIRGSVQWAGFGYTYFLTALLPEKATDVFLTVRREGPAIDMGFTENGTSAQAASRYTLFIGPKVLDLLESFDRGLQKSIDFGYFAFISVPLLHVLTFFQKYTDSYGLDIILLTILIKILLWPLTHKSFVSMKRMQRLQPQMQRIREKYGEDKERLNKEMMELYRRNKVNPLGGCLPMLLQFPVFIGLYNALRTPIELRHASFLWIKDLSRPDWESLPFTLFGWRLGVPVLVLLMGASMFIQQWMSPNVGDPNQRRLMLLMPLIFTVMFVSFPSGLTIYWFVNNLLSIAQQYLINRQMK